MKARTSLIVAATGLLSACGAESESAVAEATAALSMPVGPLAQEVTLQGALLLDPRMKEIHRTDAVPEMITAIVRGLGVDPTPGCVRIHARGDVDEDGVPRGANIGIQCQAKLATGATLSIEGRMTLADRNDNVHNDGYALRFMGLYAQITTQNGAYHAVLLDGGADYAARADKGASIQENLEWHFYQHVAGALQETLYTSKLLAEYRPDAGMRDPRDAGGLMLEGSAEWAVGGRSGELDVATVKPLHFDRRCKLDNPTQPGFDAGGLEYASSTGDSVYATFASCTNWHFSK